MYPLIYILIGNGIPYCRFSIVLAIENTVVDDFKPLILSSLPYLAHSASYAAGFQLPMSIIFLYPVPEMMWRGDCVFLADDNKRASSSEILLDSILLQSSRVLLVLFLGTKSFDSLCLVFRNPDIKGSLADVAFTNLSCYEPFDVSNLYSMRNLDFPYHMKNSPSSSFIFSLSYLRGHINRTRPSINLLYFIGSCDL